MLVVCHPSRPRRKSLVSSDSVRHEARPTRCRITAWFRLADRRVAGARCRCWRDLDPIQGALRVGLFAPMTAAGGFEPCPWRTWPDGKARRPQNQDEGSGRKPWRDSPPHQRFRAAPEKQPRASHKSRLLALVTASDFFRNLTRGSAPGCPGDCRCHAITETSSGSLKRKRFHATRGDMNPMAFERKRLAEERRRVA